MEAVFLYNCLKQDWFDLFPPDIFLPYFVSFIFLFPLYISFHSGLL